MGIDSGNCAIARHVIPSVSRESPSESFKVILRDPSTTLGMTRYTPKRFREVRERRRVCASFWSAPAPLPLSIVERFGESPVRHH
jgi:hypothetical protein